jgi:hypothetical protein
MIHIVDDSQTSTNGNYMVLPSGYIVPVIRYHSHNGEVRAIIHAVDE